MASLDKEFSYYKENQETLYKKYKDKFVVIQGHEVIGAYDSHSEAYQDCSKKYTPGTFLIQQCGLGEENYTKTFHTLRIVF